MRMSVCLATYNGARHIAAQLDSILPQLEAQDEVLVADDGSTDDTLALIAAYGSRVRIVATGRAGGVVPNFERVLAAATGEGIVLCDQDDVWLPGRLTLMRQHLANCLLVITNGVVVDDALRGRGQDVFGMVGVRRGVLRNLVKNSFIGCCMAFRRELLERVLPFPAGVPWHDWYIGLAAEALGRVERDASVTLLYRRHATNASPTGARSGNSFATMLRMRLAVARALLVAVLRRPRPGGPA
jgi:glycosyltransferase involved in cell wall biosynthesis